VHAGCSDNKNASKKSEILTTRVGLKMPDGLDFEAWEKAGQKIVHAADMFAWCIGDWLVYGEDRYSDRYRRADNAAGLNYTTPRN
jgi:hypothetical protein